MAAQHDIASSPMPFFTRIGLNRLRPLLYHKMTWMMLFFGAWYATISLVNHACFRTYALDLGAYTNALYDYAHRQFNDSTVFKPDAENLLADHFDLYLMVFSPLSYVFGTYTLLILQIAFLLLGGLGVYRFLRFRSSDRNLALMGALSFYCAFGVFAALSADYHSNVIAACGLPWFLDAAQRSKWNKALVIYILLLVAKENVALWLFFVCIGMAWLQRHERRNALRMLAFALLGIVYFGTVVAAVMPALSNAQAYPHFHYTHLGKNFGEALVHVFTRPLDTARMLFVNHTGHLHGDYVKTELHLMLLISGLPLLLWRPAYLVMLVPIYGQKLFHDNISMWGVGHQYSIEFVPVMAMGIFDVLSRWTAERTRRTVGVLVVALQLACSIRWMDRTVYYTPKSHVRIYAPDHYFRKYSIHEAHRILQQIPANDVVSAQSPFVPHLSLRDNVYQYPIVKDAQWIVLSRKEAPYPLDQIAFDAHCDSLVKDPSWETVYTDPLIVLRRK